MKKPIVLVIMDGVGRGDGGPGDAVKQANTPNLDKLMASCPMTWLKAHGTAVGLPTDDDMGNSEVGHNALGCGQIYSQGAKLVGESIESGALYESKTWKSLISNCKENEKALHFLGLLSDGNVHSNISHLIAMLQKARAEDVKRVYCHILLDGRDVPATSALEYVDQLETVLAELSDSTHEYKIASGGGRMVITMDRYEANWPMVEKGWRTHVQGEGRQFASAKEAIETYRAENPGMIDQDLLPFVVAHDGKPVAKIANGDSVILFNFRGDRAQEISLAFDRKEFTHFDRPGYTGVHFAGMLEYDGDLKIPEHYLVEPPVIKNTLTEVLCKAGVHEYAISETQKYGHVTYFWNGNRSGKVDESLEVYEEIPSDVIPFEKAPVDLYELASSVLCRLEAAAGKRGISLTLSGEHATVNGVSQVLDEMVFNLCDNAVKYSRENGHVRVFVSEENGHVALRVEDDGIGIPAADQARVFERFYRVDKSHSKEIGGTGLGLSIVKHGAAFHNARVALESELGKGTTVTVTF